MAKTNHDTWRQANDRARYRRNRENILLEKKINNRIKNKIKKQIGQRYIILKKIISEEDACNSLQYIGSKWSKLEKDRYWTADSPPRFTKHLRGLKVKIKINTSVNYVIYLSKI
jgi:hypothetical protein